MTQPYMTAGKPPPFSVQMRIAANILEEFNNRTHNGGAVLYTSDAPWRPSELRREARHVEDEEQEAAERDLMVEELAEDLCEAHDQVHTDDPFGPVARILIENGWRKDDI
jgi:hypothetical protein